MAANLLPVKVASFIAASTGSKGRKKFEQAHFGSARLELKARVEFGSSLNFLLVSSQKKLDEKKHELKFSARLVDTPNFTISNTN